MSVNWQNLAIAVKKGKMAYDNAGYGEPISDGGETISDQPFSDFIQSYEPKDSYFTISVDKWGGTAKVSD
jgi:hypothetical protein